MIDVKFTFSFDDDATLMLAEYSQTMPWLNYLMQHKEKLEWEKHYEPVTMQEVYRFKFFLPEKKETFYRLKFNQG